ncbi:ABC transporter permease/M1 family aminopeptidase [Sphingomonas jatrophae]|uniref:Peptidase family M1 n=1 Tax=Sphingomonas jatrophae TaxID=1166337 RepID=A0A1I6K092_9SPHN|nr:M1 family aminopeptidase [Sphingomonas jatrophae]SFR84597.1 Peptidase family M1 [Sphingomonas jatrophae]
MFLKIAGFELRYQLKNPVFWVTVAIFFLLTFGSMTIDQISIGGGGNTHKNAPYAIIQIHMIWTLFFMFVTTAFVANVIVRDDESGFGPIVRTTRITRFNYLFGRFTGAYAAALLAFLSVPLGILVGSWMPWVDPDTLGSNRLGDYAFAFALFAAPNILMTSALFFMLATVTRSMMTTYVGVVAFLILYGLTTSVLGRLPQYETLLAYVEPLGFGAFDLATKYWTATERNNLLPPLTGIFLWNKALWLGVAAASLALAASLFRFGVKGKKQSKKQRLAEIADATPPQGAAGPLPAPRFDRATARAQLVTRTRLEFAQVLRSPAFLVLMVLGLFNSLGALLSPGDLFGTEVLPVTREVIQTLLGAFGLIPMIVAIYYSGELVWRERDRKTHEIIDATALPDWAFVVPKTLAVVLVMLSALAISAVGGILAQLIRGWTAIEPGKYLLWYILPEAVDWTLLAVLAVFVQALSPHKFVGWGIMVLYMIATITLSNIGLADNLYQYGRGPRVQFSDMNGLGRFWIGAWWFRLYYAALAIVMLVAAHVLWRRGTETRLRPRLARAPSRLRGMPGLIGGAALVVAVGTGVWIYTNTHVWNEYRTGLDDDRWAADYEKALYRFHTAPQPSVTDVRLAVDLRPSAPSMRTTGSYALVNRTGAPLRDVHVRLTSRDLKLVSLDVPGARLLREWPRYGYRIYRYDTPLAPGQTAAIRFETLRAQRGFRNSGDERRVVANGTFLNNSEFAPQIGMTRDALLTDPTKRRKYGLPAQLRPPKLEDVAATRFNYVNRADWVNADITVTTDADQTPIAPGNRVSDTVANGRRTAHFVTEAPILSFFSVQSARYLEKHRRHGNTDLVVYYDPHHPMNVDRMLAALAAGLDYYEPNFAPYQFRQARIIEFPGYEQFAQAFAGTMPYSESIGFIADLSDKEKIDYVTYVTAHELGHQWWAHQEVSADMQGGTMLVETLAQYSALMVMEKLYGPDQIRRFLKYELDRYLRARGGERVEELPLVRVEDQGYIHYRKGSVVMYLLKDELGEAKVNAALRRFLMRFRFKGAPYPRSVDLIAEFRREATTPAQQALITDLFERITLYDLKAGAPKVTRRADGRYDVALTVNARKLYADGKGAERQAPMAEAVDIGLFTAMPGRGSFAAKDVVLMERRPIRSGTQVLRFVTARAPTFVGVDPYNKRIDRNSDDNVVPVS